LLESARLAGSRVLVVDDNASARRLIVQTLKEWGMEAAEAASLREALEALRRAAFDVVLIDDPLPDGDAGSLLAGLPERAGARPRLLRMQSFASTPRRREHDRRGFDAALKKPLRRAELRRALLGEPAPASEARAAAADAAPGATMSAAVRGPGLLAARVLVVEDQPLNREVAIGILNALGIRAETANDGRSALERLGRERFDAVLMDCEMPVMDGIAATAELRRREPPGTHLPVIALTADATPDGRAACLAAGMDDYLAKPFTRAALRATLERWLAPWSSGAPLANFAPVGPLTPVSPAPEPAPVSHTPAPAPAPEPLLDPATLAGLRALPPAGSQDMLSHIGERYISDSRELLDAMRRALEAGQAVELARAAHAWRSYNGNLGALGLARLCRNLEDAARRGAFESARELLPQILALHARVCDELQGEMRRSA
jgi:CheY-like chemotaxis protein